MPSTFYIARNSRGLLISRESERRADFTHAAVPGSWNGEKMPNFSVSENGARYNFDQHYKVGTPCEIVRVWKVDGKTYRAARKAAKAGDTATVIAIVQTAATFWENKRLAGVTASVSNPPNVDLGDGVTASVSNP